MQPSLGLEARETAQVTGSAKEAGYGLEQVWGFEIALEMLHCMTPMLAPNARQSVDCENARVYTCVLEYSELLGAVTVFHGFIRL